MLCHCSSQFLLLFFTEANSLFKDSNKDVFLIEHEVFLYEEDYPTLKDLETYKEKFSYGFASQVTQEIKDIVEAFHNGYGCIQLNSGDY